MRCGNDLEYGAGRGTVVRRIISRPVGRGNSDAAELDLYSSEVPGFTGSSSIGVRAVVLKIENIFMRSLYNHESLTGGWNSFTSFENDSFSLEKETQNKNWRYGISCGSWKWKAKHVDAEININIFTFFIVEEAVDFFLKFP